MRKAWLILILITILITLSANTNANHAHPERWYQETWCSECGGRSEVTLPDGTRADCLTATHIIEFDFGDKWTEALGQSLYYSLQTGKRAGIVLIIEDIQDRKYWIRLNTTIDHFKLPIDAWSAGEGVVSKK